MKVKDAPSLAPPGVLLLGIAIGAIGALAWVWALKELIGK